MNPLELLKALTQGSQPARSLSDRLRWSPGQVDLALQQLRRGGYVAPTPRGCASGCGGCNVRSFCSGHSQHDPQDDSWHLTDKGKLRVQAS